MSERTGYVCVLLPDKNLCWFCGEWLHSTQRDGFDGPHGNRYCSLECVSTVEHQLAAEVVSDWCESCGFDRHEHAPDCVKVAHV